MFTTIILVTSAILGKYSRIEHKHVDVDDDDDEGIGSQLPAIQSRDNERAFNYSRI